jgi:hypothetical protein
VVAVLLLDGAATPSLKVPAKLSQAIRKEGLVEVALLVSKGKKVAVCPNMVMGRTNKSNREVMRMESIFLLRQNSLNGFFVNE